MKNITLKDLSINFGCDVSDFSYRFINFFNTLDMRYESIEGDEEKQVILDILKKIDKDSQKIGAQERIAVWYNGWEENLNDFITSKEESAIVPKFIRPNKIIRFGGKYIKPKNSFFEKNLCKLIQFYIYHTFISEDIENVYEFGCGSGFNLLALSKIREDVNLYGSDFVQSAVDLINEMANHYDIKMRGDIFDMIEPDYNYDIKNNSCIFTFGAVEQLASKFENFVDYLLVKKPKVCFHIEPTVEFYDEKNLFDYLAIKFHKQRGYSEGFVPYLKKLEEEGKIEIDTLHRFNFGSKFMEGYQLVAWRVT